MLFSPSYAAGAGPERGSWIEVQALEKGQTIKIATKSGQTHKGAFVGLTDASLVILGGTTEISVGKAEVLQVQAKSGGRRARNVLIGAGVGLALGVVIDQTVGRYLRNEPGETTGSRVATIALPPVVLGGIAAAFPGYRTVYRAPKGHP